MTRLHGRVLRLRTARPAVAGRHDSVFRAIYLPRWVHESVLHLLYRQGPTVQPVDSQGRSTLSITVSDGQTGRARTITHRIALRGLRGAIGGSPWVADSLVLPPGAGQARVLRIYVDVRRDGHGVLDTVDLAGINLTARA